MSENPMGCSHSFRETFPLLTLSGQTYTRLSEANIGIPVHLHSALDPQTAVLRTLVFVTDRQYRGVGSLGNNNNTCDIGQN